MSNDIIGSGDSVIVQRLQTETERERLIREALEREFWQAVDAVQRAK